MSAPVDEFARKLIETVRDGTITSASVLKNRHSRSPERLALNKFDPGCVDQVFDLLIPDIVDDTLFHLLRAVDGGDIRLVYVTDDGRNCDLQAEGSWELAGWLNGEDGWVSRFSKFCDRTARPVDYKIVRHAGLARKRSADREGVLRMLKPRFEAAEPVPEPYIQEIERRLGRSLPGDYRSFVATYGGAFVGGLVDGSEEWPVLAFFGKRTGGGILDLLGWHPDLEEEGILPIADCEFGNLYVLDTDNSVHYVNYYGGRTTTSRVAEAFQEFLDRIVVPEEE